MKDPSDSNKDAGNDKFGHRWAHDRAPRPTDKDVRVQAEGEDKFGVRWRWVRKIIDVCRGKR